MVSFGRLAVAIAFIGGLAAVEAADLYGLASIDEFCAGTGRLDELRNLVDDVYQRETGRSTVSFLKRN